MISANTIFLTCKKVFIQSYKQFLGKNYKDNAHKFQRGNYCHQKHLYEHLYFCETENTGFMEDISITQIDKTNSLKILAQH